jgi:hypothetical protein
MYVIIPIPVSWFRLWVDVSLTIIDFLSRSIQHILPQCRLFNEVLKSFNQIVGQETYVIIVTKDVLVGKTIGTRIAQFPTVDALCILPLHKYSCDVGNEETMLTISVVGFLNSLWRTTLLQLSLMQQCAKWYSCSEEESDHRSIALSTIPKLSLLHSLTSRRFYRCVVLSTRVQTGGWRE